MKRVCRKLLGLAIIVIIAMGLLDTGILKAGTVNLGDNLIPDPGGEAATSNSGCLINNGWAGSSRPYSYSGTLDTVSPHGGSRFMAFYASNGASTSLTPFNCYRDIDISSQSTNIDNNTLAFTLSGYLCATGGNTGTIRLEELNESGGVLNTQTIERSITAGTWTNVQISDAVLSGTRTLRVIIEGTVANIGVAAFDDLSLVLSSNTDQPPVVSQISNQSIVSGDSLGPINFTATDVENDSLTVTASSSNTALIPNTNISVGLASGSGTVSLTSVSGQTGDAVITIAVSDGTKTTRMTFTVTVNPAIEMDTNLVTNGTGESKNGWTDQENRFTYGTSFGIYSLPQGMSAYFMYQDINVAKFSDLIDAGFLTYAASCNATGGGTITLQGYDAAGGFLWQGSGTSSLPGGTRKVRVQIGGPAGCSVDNVSFMIKSTGLPKMTSISDQTVKNGGNTGDLAFLLGYKGSSVSLTAQSSDPTIVPGSNITFGGSGYHRTIKVTAQSGVSGSSDITVYANGTALASFKVNSVISVTGVTINPQSRTLMVGETFTLSAAVSPGNATNQNLTWESSDTHVVTVDSNGEITGVNPGTATITVTTEDGNYKDTCSIVVCAMVNLPTIGGVSAPARAGVPAGTVTETEQYTGTVMWTPGDSPFKANTVYTATITLTPKPGYTLSGVGANFFTVTGASTVSNNADSGVITAVFPATGAEPVNLPAIGGVSVPVRGVTPAGTVIETEQYTGTVAWLPSDSVFKANTVYTATITLTPKAGYTLSGVEANFFTVAGAGTVSNSADSGIITAVFPATGAEPVNLLVIGGVSVPVRGVTPVTSVTETEQYTGTVTWSPSDSVFKANTVYTATITLTPKAGYTLSGVEANFFTLAGASTVSNNTDSGVITAVFPATGAEPVNLPTIGGVSVPVRGLIPAGTVIETEQYTGTVTWSPSDSVFKGNTVYTATITLKAKAGYTLTGVGADFFTVAGAGTVSNPADSGVITAVFPVTEAEPVNLFFIGGVVAPARGATPVSSVTETAQYTGTVTWTPDDASFKANTVYTATITLTPKAGYTLTSVGANFFMVPGASMVSNAAGSGVITAQFSATGAESTYTVIFKDWNGMILKTETVNSGAAATAPPNPIRPDYLFVGWDREFGIITGDLTVTARYNPFSDGSDKIKPTVTGVLPNGTDAGISGNLVIRFSETMNTLEGMVSLDKGAIPLIRGAWSDNNMTYTVPYFNLTYGTGYTLTISGFKDAAGNVMAEDKSHSFTTEAEPLAPSASPASLLVDKGNMAGFSVALGQGSAAATSATITVGNNAIVSVSQTQLTASGGVLVMGLAVGTTNITVTFNDTNSTVKTLSVTVQSVAPLWLSGSSLAAGGVTSSSATLTWSAALNTTGVSGYKLYQNGTEIASVGGSVYSYTVTGLAPSTGYTFQVQAGNADGVWSTLGPTVTVTTQPLPPSGGDQPSGNGPSYTVKTISDSITGITLSGTLTANAALKLGELILSDSNAGSAIQQMMENKQWTLVWGRDISITGGFQGTLNITIPVGTQYNGQTVTILHDAQGTLEAYTAVVENGQVSFSVSSLSPFVVFVPSGKDSPQAASHSITVDNDGNGTGSAGVAGAVQGEKVTLTATPKPGYRFKEWQIITPADLSLSGNTLTMPDQAVVVKAVFEAEKIEPAEQGGERIYGETRYDTAIEIAKAYFQTGTATVILVRGDSSVDALPAVPLAKAYNAPLLLTQPDRLPAGVLEEIKALGAKKVIIIGGPGAVKGTVEESLKTAGLQVERIYGQTQYDTAYEIAKRLGGTTGQAVLVNGNLSERTYADALSISAWAGYNGVPILYVDSTSNKLPEATARALSELKISRTLLIGGKAVVPASLEKLVPNPERYGGTTAYDTNVLVLKNLQPDPGSVYLATGKGFADALAGAAVAAQSNGWLILTGGSAGGLTGEQEELLRGVGEGIKGFQVFGGPAVLPESTLESVRSILGL